MLADRGRVDRPLGDRPEEARLVRKTGRELVVAADGNRGRDRREALGGSGVDPAVHESHRLLEVVPYPDPSAGQLLSHLEDLEPVQGVEARKRGNRGRVAHGAMTLLISSGNTASCGGFGGYARRAWPR